MKFLALVIGLLLFSQFSHADHHAYAIQVAMKSSQLAKAIADLKAVKNGTPRASKVYSFGDGGEAVERYLISQPVKDAQAFLGQHFAYVVVQLNVQFMDENGEELKQSKVVGSPEVRIAEIKTLE